MKDLINIVGSGGGGGKDEGSGGGRAAVEDSDTLQSREMITLVDLLGEGVIKGLVSGAKSIFCDDTPLQNEDGSYNFNGLSWEYRLGTQDQDAMPGFTDVETVIPVGVKVPHSTPHTITIDNPNTDFVSLVVSVPSLYSQDKSNGDMHGSSVDFSISVSTDGGTYKPVNAGDIWQAGGTVGVSGGYPSVTGTPGCSGVAVNVFLTNYLFATGEVVFMPQHFVGGEWLDFGQTYSLSTSANTTTSAPNIRLETRSSDQLRFRIISNTCVFSTDPPAGVYYDEFRGGWGKYVSSGFDLDGGGSWTPWTPPDTSSPVGIELKEAQSIVKTSNLTLSGKTRSKYQRAYRFALPKPGTTWNVRLTRLTADSDTAAVQNEVYFDSYSEITDVKLSYPNSAIVGVRIDSSQFNSIPTRTYLVDGRLIRVPSNYNVTTRTYTGVWNGTFKTDCSNNPAWVLYDLLTHKRFGLGQYISESMVDKSKLYQIAKYCDELVPDGYGGVEPRFTLNTVINGQADAYKVIADICSVFRGMAYKASDSISFFQDSPEEPSLIYTPANVVDGVFTYSGSSRKDRHSVAVVAWNDASQAYKLAYEYVEDRELIEKFGVRKTSVVAFGCTSRGQAHRVGKWLLYTEKYETDIISFKVGLDSALLLPGDVVWIHDHWRAGKRLGGRLLSSTTNSAVLDSEIDVTSGSRLVLMLPDGSIAETTVVNSGITNTVHWSENLDTKPEPGAMFVLIEPDLVPVLARVVNIKQNGKDGFEITAVEHNPSKFDAIEYGLTLEDKPTTIGSKQVIPHNISVVESKYKLNDTSAGLKLIVSWTGNSTNYELQYRRISGSDGSSTTSNWTTIVTSNPSEDILNVSVGDTYQFQLVGINPFGSRTQVVTFNHTVLGVSDGYPIGAVSGGAYFWNGRDCKLSWNFNSVTQSYEFGAEPNGADDGLLDPNFKDYEVRIYNVDGTVLRRTEYVTSNTYTYTYDKNYEDGLTRHIRVKIRQRDLFNQFGKSAVVDCENPPPTITGVEVTPKYDSITFSYTQNGDPDFAGVVIYLSDDPNHIMSLDAQYIVYDGPDSSIPVGGVMFNTDYYYRMYAYDVFGKSEVIVTEMANTHTPFMDIDAIAEGVLGGSKLVPELQDKINLVDDADTVVGSVNQRLKELETKVNLKIDGDIGTAIETLETQITDGNTAIAESISVIEAKSNDNQAAIATEVQARTDADTSLSTSISTLASRVGGAESAIQAESTARANGDNANATSISTLAARLDTGDIHNSISALNTSVSSVETSLSSKADASTVNTLSTTVSGHTSTLQTQAQSINGVLSKYTVKIDNNGYVSGYGLISENNNGTVVSEFIVNADKFAVISPGAPSDHPFTIGSVNGVTKTIIKSAMIGDASINTAKIGDAQVSTLKIGSNQVTVPISATYSNAISGAGDGNWITVATVYVTAGADPLPVLGMFTAAVGYSAGIRHTGYRVVTSGGVLVDYTAVSDAAYTVFPAFHFFDTVPANTTYAFTVQWYGQDSTTGMTKRSLTILGVKR